MDHNAIAMRLVDGSGSSFIHTEAYEDFCDLFLSVEDETDSPDPLARTKFVLAMLNLTQSEALIILDEFALLGGKDDLSVLLNVVLRV